METTILLVEDDQLIALDERLMLQRNDYRVVHVSCGEDALDYMAAHHDSVDLVLMDIDLGAGIDGPETARRLLASYTVPVTFLSSHTEREIVERTENITSYGYIVKNSGETVIVASIKMALRLFAARQELEVREQRLRWVTDSIEECFWVRSPDNRRMLYISPAYETIWHQSCASVLECPDSFFDSIDSRDRSRVTQALLEYEESRQFDENYRIRRPDGTVRWISARALPVLDAEGMVVAHTGVARDITR